MPEKASTGACMMAAVWGAASSITTVTTAATMANRQMPQPYGAPASRRLHSPMRCPSSTVTPMASPVMTMVMDCMIWAAGGHGGDVRSRAEAPHNL